MATLPSILTLLLAAARAAERRYGGTARKGSGKSRKHGFFWSTVIADPCRSVTLVNDSVGLVNHSNGLVNGSVGLATYPNGLVKGLFGLVILPNDPVSDSVGLVNYSNGPVND